MLSKFCLCNAQVVDLHDPGIILHALWIWTLLTHLRLYNTNNSGIVYMQIIEQSKSCIIRTKDSTACVEDSIDHTESKVGIIITPVQKMKQYSLPCYSMQWLSFSHLCSPKNLSYLCFEVLLVTIHIDWYLTPQMNHWWAIGHYFCTDAWRTKGEGANLSLHNQSLDP